MNISNFKVSVPKNCGDSSFCAILKKLVGPDAKFRIAGVVQTSYYKVTAGFYGIRLYKDYQLSKLELFCEVLFFYLNLLKSLRGYFFQPSRRFTSIQKVPSVFLSAISDGSDAVQTIHQIFRMVGRRLKQKYPRNRKSILDGRLLHFFQPSKDGASMSFQNHG